MYTCIHNYEISIIFKSEGFKPRYQLYYAFACLVSLTNHDTFKACNPGTSSKHLPNQFQTLTSLSHIKSFSSASDLFSFCPTPALSLAPEILANDRTPGADPDVYEPSLWQGLCNIPQLQDTFIHCRHVLSVLAMGSMGRFSTTAKPHMASSSALKAARFFSDLSVSAGLWSLDQCTLPLERNQQKQGVNTLLGCLLCSNCI